MLAPLAIPNTRLCGGDYQCLAPAPKQPSGIGLQPRPQPRRGEILAIITNRKGRRPRCGIVTASQILEVEGSPAAAAGARGQAGRLRGAANQKVGTSTAHSRRASQQGFGAGAP